MTIKLLWLPGVDTYGLRVFAGPDSADRLFRGELRLPPEYAVAFRSLLLAGDATLGREVLSEAGWEDPTPPAASAAA